MIFILGGKGFVGSAFTRFCEANNIEHLVINKENYNDFKHESCEIFINANGNSDKVLAKQKPYDDFQANVINTQKSLYDFKFKKYIYLSSNDVYSDCSSISLTKENLEIDVSKLSSYGFHKYLAEICVQHATSDWLILRLGGMVGIGLRKNPIFDIMSGGPLWVDPQSELQFLNTDKVAEIIFHLIDKNISNEIFNICGREPIRLEEIIKLAKPVKVNHERPMVKYNVNIEKIMNYVEIPLTINTIKDFFEF